MFDAVVLAGGRSRRLGSVPKAGLVVDGRTLLERTLEAVRTARTIVVVGPEPAAGLPQGVLSCREDPPFGGPAAGLATGLAALPPDAEAVAVFACDMPQAAALIPVLTAAFEASVDGVIAADAAGRLQPLAALYRRRSLEDAVQARKEAGGLDGASMFGLVRRLSLTSVTAPHGSTDDVDTWEDADRLGARRPQDGPEPHSTAPYRTASFREEQDKRDT